MTHRRKEQCIYIKSKKKSLKKYARSLRLFDDLLIFFLVVGLPQIEKNPFFLNEILKRKFSVF
jgi:hypothetical protein